MIDKGFIIFIISLAIIIVIVLFAEYKIEK